VKGKEGPRMLRGRTSAVAVLTLALAALTASGCGGGSSSKGPTAVNWYVFKEPGGAFDAAAAKCTKDSGGRYKVNVVALPTDSDQQRELIVRRLAAKDSSLDVLGMDVNWTAEPPSRGSSRRCSPPRCTRARRGWRRSPPTPRCSSTTRTW
jgi:ABC-type glycerol-3-phosphate transport system substrate-binding protein